MIAYEKMMDLMEAVPASERFQLFVSKHPDILQRVALKHIGSYLGIDIATLISRIYYIYGMERYGMKEMLEEYSREFHPEVEKVSETPITLLRFIAFLTRNRQYHGVAAVVESAL